MNYKQKNNARKDVLGLFRSNYNEGCVKITNETKEHFRVKCEVAHFYKKQNYMVWCEPTLIGWKQSRPDLLVLHPNGDAYIIEILATETEKKFSHKEIDYPLPIRKIYVKDFKYEDFAI